MTPSKLEVSDSVCGYIFFLNTQLLDNVDDAYILKGRCDEEDYGNILKRLFGAHLGGSVG